MSSRNLYRYPTSDQSEGMTVPVYFKIIGLVRDGGFSFLFFGFILH